MATAAEKKAGLAAAKKAGMKKPAFITVDEAYLEANPGIKNPAGELVKVGDELIVDTVENLGNKGDVTKVLFTRKDGTTREFTEEVHGENFIALADEFGATNEKFIASRKDL